MSKRRKVTFEIDEDLFEQWNRVSKKLGVTKVYMLREFLKEVLPVLDDEPSSIIKSAMLKNLELQRDLTNNLFENIDNK